MAIIFHEGLPGAGKSYAAMKDFIVPALQKGRAIYAYIEGLNHERIAEVAGIDLEKCRELLHPLDREQVPEIHKHVENDALVIIDELQNFFPSQRQPLTPEMTQFVTEHRHRGLDILTMGQSLKDCHNTWRRRMSQKVYFYKREALGKPNEFQTIVYKAVPHKDDLRWEEVTKSAEKYDEKYFGTYSSHTDDTTNKETFTDKRAVIWNNPIFKKWLPIYGAVVLGAIYIIYDAFAGGAIGHPEKKEHASKPAQVQTAHTPQAIQPAQPVAVHPAPAAAPKQADTQAQPKSMVGDNSISMPSPPPDAIDRLSQFYRVRLGGFIESARGTQGFIEWRNDSFEVVERMSFVQLRGLGWMVMLDSQANLAFLQKYDSRYIVTAWPIPTPQGQQVPKETIDALRPSAPAASADAAPAQSPLMLSTNDSAYLPDDQERYNRLHLVNGRTKPGT